MENAVMSELQAQRLLRRTVKQIKESMLAEGMHEMEAIDIIRLKLLEEADILSYGQANLAEERR